MMKIADFLQPSLLIIVLLLLALLLYKKRIGRWILAFSILLYYLIGTGVIASALIWINTPSVSSPINDKKPDDIIVLGGGLTQYHHHFTPSLSGDARLLHALSLYKYTTQKIYISGGSLPNRISPSEGELYKNVLISAGLPADNIIIETKAKNTAQNALFLGRMLNKDKCYYLVTGATHMKRAMYLFRQHHICVIASTSDYPSVRLSWLPLTQNYFITGQALHEWLGYFAAAYLGLVR